MRRGLATGLVLVGVAWLVPLGAQASCHGMFPPCVGLTNDRYVFTYQNQFTPASVDVKAGGRLILNNLDSVPHTLTDARCLDGIATTPCEFDVLLEAGLLRSAVLYTGPDPDQKPDKAPVGTYTLECKFHGPRAGGTMAGTLSVTY